MYSRCFTLWLTTLVAGGWLSLCAQTKEQAILHPLGDTQSVRKAVMHANNVGISAYNVGLIHRAPTTGFVWKGLDYVYEFGLLFAAEVAGQSGDTLHIVDDGLRTLFSGDFAPGGVTKWGWLPRPEFLNASSGSLAVSNDPTSWPASWSEWPGEFGAGKIAGLAEAVFAMDDFTNAEFEYVPFPSDPEKRGLGVSVLARVYQCGGPLKDAILLKYTIRNESPRELPGCYLGFYGDENIGGPIDYGDDRVGFIGDPDSLPEAKLTGALGTIYVWDGDSTGEGGIRPGYLGYRLLETPLNRGMTSFSALPWGGISPKNDEGTWLVLSADSIDLHQDAFQSGGDYITMFGTGPFSLAPGESTAISVVMFCSDSFLDLVHDAHYLSYAGHWPEVESAPGSTGGDPACSVRMQSLPSGRVTGTVDVTWTYSGTVPGALATLEVSSDQGLSWNLLAWDHVMGQPYSWDTKTVPDGTHYLLRVVAYDQDRRRHAYSVIEQPFIVDNEGNARPEVAVDVTRRDGYIRDMPAIIRWLATDADNQTLNVDVSYSRWREGPFTTILSGNQAGGQYALQWDCADLPNGVDYYLRAWASDGQADSAVVSGPFQLWLETGTYPPATFAHLSGRATPDLKLQVVDSTLLTGHTYELTFSAGLAKTFLDTVRSMNLRDVTASAAVLSGYPVVQGESTPMFDGLKLTVNERPLGIDSAGSGWTFQTTTTLEDWVGIPQALPSAPFIPAPIDVEFRWGSTDTTAAGKWLSPLDTLLNNAGRKVVLCPFRVVDVTDSSPLAVLVDRAMSDSVWRPGREIVVVTPETYRPSTSLAKMFGVKFSSPSDGPTILPGAGEAYLVASSKPLTTNDVFRFTSDRGYVLDVPDAGKPLSHVLHQNFPNPFNPSTTIRYELPARSHVKLTVFNTLGQQVAVLLEGEQEAGLHEVRFEASDLASGVYFYRLEVRHQNAAGGHRSQAGPGDFVQVRKLLLVH